MKQSKEHTTWQVLSYHWKHAMQFPKLAITSFIVAPVTIIIERYLTPLIIAGLLLGIQRGDITLGATWWLVAIYALLQIMTQVIGYRVNLYAMWAVQTLGERAIYNEIYEKLTRQSLGFYSDNFAGSLVSRVNRIVGAYVSFWNMVVFEVLFVVTAIVATIIGSAILVWQYAVAVAILVTVFIIVSYYATRFMRPRQKARSEAYTKISAQLSDSISNMFAVKIDSREKYEHRRLKKPVDAMVAREFDVRRGIMTVSTIYSSIIATMKIAVLVASIWAVEQGMANVAVVYLLLTYTFNLIEEMSKISGTFRTIYQITGDSEEMLDTLAEPIAVQDTSSRALSPSKASILFKDIMFGYDEKSQPIFEDFSLHIPPDQKIGIVGVSGSGKTTLTKLLMRFVDPGDGHVSIDDTNISSVSQKSLHDAIAFVPQEPLLFHRSLGENISYSRPGASEKDIIAAAKKAHAHEFIKSLPEGYATLVGERGVKLSGGQRQRVAIARAILKDAPILVLDEATSALDSESELLIQQAIENLWHNKTAIVIAHRLSTIAKLDRIIVLDNGKIIEDGTHAELLKQHGTYASLWNHQSGGFIEE